MSNHQSLNNVLYLLLSYLNGEEFTMSKLMSMTKRSERTINNYHNTLKEYGFVITRDTSSGLHSLAERDETSVHRLIRRLGLYQATFFSEDSEVQSLRAVNQIKPGLEDFPYDELKVLYNLYINPDIDVDLNQIPTIEYKQLVNIINYLNSLNS